MERAIPVPGQGGKKRPVYTADNTKKILARLGLGWRDMLVPGAAGMLAAYLKDPEATRLVSFQRGDDEKSRRESTTLWDYPRQRYGKKPKGSNKYAGATGFVRYNMIKRYTEPGDLMLDPMAGSGTTLDVCGEEGRGTRCLTSTPRGRR